MNLSQLLSIFAASGSAPTVSSYVMTFVPLALILVFFYFFIIKPQKKQEKQDREMRDNLDIGDEIITNGGIVGIVTQIKDDTVVVETGGDRSKIRVMKWAIAKVVSDKEEDTEKDKA
ncbi:preprotein translocase subunit YajC [uncultured Ruminococcus sp.]|uniref:preprotein translocase subunit YajC n=1 Tax=uncultured Ruminococcus sp. TaxID=165186 RepID=UPI000EDF162E|nr:preprotein translocase subunit YajC [uncultured Ruminococcus sp.]HCJ41829.1 preprotein translocase subunit YajC [Ruminococcus sp.]